MKKRIGAILLGGSGYGVGELLRYLVFHPEVEVVQVTSGSNINERLEDLHTHLSGFYPKLFCQAEVNIEALAAYEFGIIFSSLPHGTSSIELEKILNKKLPANVSLIDLSGDLRLGEEEVHLKHYPDIAFNKELRSQFAYCIPELHQVPLKKMRHISNPGCLSTAGALSLAPLCAPQIKLVNSVFIDAKTGTSGAGRSANAAFHHPLRHGNFEAYKILAHRHEPEIRQAAGLAEKVPLAFVPHLLPVSRGIFATLYATLDKSSALSQTELESHFKKFYDGRYFIRFRKQTPNLSDVVGTNFADLSINVRAGKSGENQVVIIAALDNMGKGMAGQAIQNMNIVCGFEETLGLKIPALGVN